ncbi:MAG TPA: PAS domain S-box protein [Methylomirabilota bacterium]|nr:PAS domain S-box protein [Methylomirabilota bacterium]
MAVAKEIHILVIQESAAEAERIMELFQTSGYSPHHERVQSPDELAEALDRGGWDVILSDFALPQLSAAQALEMLRKRGEDIPFLLVASLGSEERAVHTMRMGAQDYVPKESLARLVPAVEREMKEAGIRKLERASKATLRMEERRYRLLVEKSSEVALILDSEARILYASHSSLAVLGWNPQELVGREAFMLLEAGEVARAKAHFQTLLRKARSSGSWEYQIRRKDGAIRWVAMTGTNLLNEPGLLGIVVNFHDVTERKHAEAEKAQLVEELRERVKEQTCLYGCAKLLQNLDQPPEVTLAQLVELIPSGWRYASRASARVRYAQHDVCTLGLRPETKDVESAAFATSKDNVGVLEVWYRKPYPGGEKPKFLPEEIGLMQSIADLLQNYFQAIHARNMIATQERYFRALIESTTDIVSLLDENGVVRYESPAVERLLGWTPAELVGTCAFDLIHPDDFGRVVEVFRTNIPNQGAIASVEYRFRHKTGAWRVMESVAKNLLQDPAIGAVVVNSRDNTERKRTEEALKRSEERFRHATRATREIIWERDFQTGKIWWSEAMAERAKYSANEVGASVEWWRARIHPEDAERVARELEVVTARQETRWSSEYRFRARDGAYLTVLDQGYLIYDGEGKPLRMIGAMKDITEKREMEARFLRAQRMESIGTLAGGIAHDLNNVLAPILMGIELFRMDGPTPQQENLLSTMESSAKRGADLVRQVLSFARGMDGKRLPLNPAHLGAEVKKIVKETFPKDILFAMESPKDLWCVQGDPTQLHQVLMNLCVNARDAMPHGGSLTVSFQNVTLDKVFSEMCADAKPGPYVEIKVRDTGTGIPQSIRDRIFDPFFTTKDIGKGTGLGLSTTLAIIKSHGGFLNFTSEVGKGTTFSLCIPANPAEKTEAAEDQTPALRSGNGEVVLIVDDEQAIRDVMRKALETSGYRVLSASNGAEAIAVYAEHSREVAAVITDMLMPIMDGSATVTALRAINPALKIIVSTGQQSKEWNGRARLAGVNRVIPKPYTAHALLGTVNDVLHEEPATVAIGI